MFLLVNVRVPKPVVPPCIPSQVVLFIFQELFSLENNFKALQLLKKSVPLDILINVTEGA